MLADTKIGRHIMSNLTQLISTAAGVISAIGTSVAAAGVWFAHRQLVAGREIAQMQFEDGLAKEYRDLASRLPTSALLGDPLDEGEYSKAFDELFRYVDLSNEQVCLRQFGRIGPSVWEQWRQGIEANLRLPAFSRAWSDIKARSRSFQELRRLEREGFAADPKEWSEASSEAPPRSDPPRVFQAAAIGATAGSTGEHGGAECR